MGKFPITEKYRTIHSLNDNEVSKIIEYLDKLEFVTETILDYGCHMGHLSIELALRYPVTIYAVDYFVGTFGDDCMKETVDKVTGGSGNFYETVIGNIKEVGTNHKYQGAIIPMHSDIFFPVANEIELALDFAFIDSSHRAEEVQEFSDISKMIRQGGILAGHDLRIEGRGADGVRLGVASIEKDYTWLTKSNAWFMKKK